MQPKFAIFLGLFLLTTGNLALFAFAQDSTTDGLTDPPTYTTREPQETETSATDPPETQSPSTEGTTRPSEGTTTPTSTTVDWGQCGEGSDQMEPPQCPPEDDPSGSEYFPFPYDCTQYFQCTHGVPRCFKCPPGTVWDQAGTVCNFESEVGCVIVTTASPRPTTTTNPPTEGPTSTDWN